MHLLRIITTLALSAVAATAATVPKQQLELEGSLRDSDDADCVSGTYKCGDITFDEQTQTHTSAVMVCNNGHWYKSAQCGVSAGFCCRLDAMGVPKCMC